MKTIAYSVMVLFCVAMVDLSSAQTKPTKTYNGDSTRHHKKSHPKSSSKNVPENRDHVDSLNQNLKNNRTPGRVDTVRTK